MDYLRNHATSFSTDFTKCFVQEANRQAPLPTFTKAAYKPLNDACRELVSDYYKQQYVWGDIIKKTEGQTPDSIVLVYKELQARGYLQSEDAFWKCEVASVRANYPIPTLDAKFESSKTSCTGASFDDKLLLEPLQKMTDWKAVMQQVE